MNTKPINVVVYVSGGNVTDVITDCDLAVPLRVHVLDYDNGYGVAEDDMEARKRWDIIDTGDGTLASIGTHDPLFEPQAIKSLLQAAEELKGK